MKLWRNLAKGSGPWFRYVCGTTGSKQDARWAIGDPLRDFWIVACLLVGWGVPATAQQFAADAWILEQSGDAAQAEQYLRQAIANSPGNTAALRALAEFLERHRNLEARFVYQLLLNELPEDDADRAGLLSRVAALDALAGDADIARRRLVEARGFTGEPAPPELTPLPEATDFILIPGPLEGFARLTAISPELNAEEIMPALARNIVMNGYRAQGANGALEQTEFLTLVLRYLTQARELEALAGEDQVIRIGECESENTALLLRIIGYRMRGGCGAEVVLETINASRAFLTSDSGFPLGELEYALRTNQLFELDFRPTRVPILYTRDYWQEVEDQEEGDLLTFFLSDPSLARLYVGMSKIDPEVAEALRQRMPSRTLKLFAHVLDFFGGMFEMENGRAIVPGGQSMENAWEDLNGGVDPEDGAEFYERMLLQDDGWLASYFDAVARMNGPLREYMLNPDRLERFYRAVRGSVTTPGPARPIFRSNTDMLLLTARLYMDADGTPHLPGGLNAWKTIFSDPPRGVSIDRRIRRDSRDWDEKDQVIEAMFGQTRFMAENEVLKLFMALTDLDRHRAEPLDQETALLLAESYSEMGGQFPLFGEVSTVSNQTIRTFLNAAERISDIGNETRRADAAGIMQALTALWQIFARHQMIRADRADQVLAGVVEPFVTVDNNREIFDAARVSLDTLLAGSESPEGDSLQGRLMDLLAGTAAPTGSVAYQRLVQDLIRIFNAQRLVEVDDIFEMAGHFGSLQRGEQLDMDAAGRLANRFDAIRLPEADLTRAERNSGAYGFWSDRHIDQQRDSNLRRDLERNAEDPEDLWEQREKLVPYLRDSLVGLVYVHYAPPGAQILLTNPLFVRNHDFLGAPGDDDIWMTSKLYGEGWPSNAGGRLIGSLSGLPYALAEVEQNFLIPAEEQALIWGDLVPQMMVTAVVPRFWNVTPRQMHWVGLNTALAESLLAESVFDADRRAQVIDILHAQIPPSRLHRIEQLLRAGQVPDAVAAILPSEMYLLGRGAMGLPDDAPTGNVADAIRRLMETAPDEVGDEAISRAFGTPKPTLANSYRPELLNLRTFPTLMGYSSRILAESWESNILYFAALADEIHAAPSDLNYLVPEWTRGTAEQIFATHLEDWPALLRSLHRVGDQVREERTRQASAATAGDRAGQ